MIKGQKMPEEVKIRKSKTDFKNLVAKYNWIIAEPYLDIEINNGAARRKRKHITLRDFKQNIKNEIPFKEMVQQGVSHHLIAFLSNFCQGKIKLEKEDFIKEYEVGKSLDEISEKYNVNRSDLTYLRQLYKIKRKGANFIKRKKTEIRLTQRQIEILYGSMMGDAKALSLSAAAFKHSIKQKEYLFWKFSEFKSVCKEKNLKKYSQYDKRYDKYYYGWSFYTKANTDVETCIKEFYNTGIKEITPQILDKITPLGLAVWFMDDGIGGYNNKYTTGHNSTPEARFCTDSFSLKSCNNILEWFRNKYNFTVVLRERELKDRMGYRVLIRSNSVYDFFNIIRPYILPSMLYKIDYNSYVDYREKKKFL